MEWWQSAIFLFGGLILLLATGLHIAFALGIMAIVGMLFFWGGIPTLSVLGITGFTNIASFSFTAVPMFIFMAELVLFTDINRKAMVSIEMWFGRMPGSLAITSTAVATLFGAASGFAPATAAALGPMAIPEMLKRGYDKGLAVGTIGGGASLDILIPPSILMILYGMLAEVSVGRLYFAGIIPGLVSSAMFMLYIAIRARLNPRWAPAVNVSYSWKEKISSLINLVPLGLLIFLVLVVIYLGVCTVTEAAALGAIGALVLAIMFRALTWPNLRSALLSTARTTGMLFLIIIAAAAFTQVMVYLQIPAQLAELVSSQGISRWMVLILSQLLLGVLGCFLDAGSILLVTTPIFAPVMKALGFDLIWFGIICMINMELATLTPPVGLNLFVLKAISPPEISFNDIVRGCAPFMAMHCLTMLTIAVFPALALWLPGLMKGI
jgi:C4-dicarboxylate transporter DctM subunit